MELEAESTYVEYPLRVETDPDGTTFVQAENQPDRLMLQLGKPATYRIGLPETASYYLWARARWHDICANSFAVKIDAQRDLRIGNDEVLGEWHWVRYPLPIELAKGEHTVAIDLVEPRAQIDRLTFTTETGVPGSFTASFADVLPESMENWTVRHPEKWISSSSNGWLVSELPTDRFEYAVRNGIELSGSYHVTATVTLLSRRADFAVLFDYRQPDTFQYCRLSSSGVVVGHVVKGKTQEKRGGAGDSAHPTSFQFAPGNRCEVDLRVQRARLFVWLNGELIHDGPIQTAPGRIGIGSTTGDVLFHELSAEPVRSPSFTNRFHTDYLPVDQISGLDVVSGRWLRSQGFDSPMLYSLESFAVNGPALAVSGSRSWRNYTVSAAVRGFADVWTGLICEYLNEDNYTCLQVRPGRGDMELVRRRGGKDEVVGRAQVDCPLGEWRWMSLETSSKGLRAFFDYAPVIDVPRNGGDPGRVGMKTELISPAPPRPRPPSLYPEIDLNVYGTFQVPLQMYEGSNGAYLVFGYRDPQDYHFVGLEQRPEYEGAQLCVGRYKGGRRDILKLQNPMAAVGGQQHMRISGSLRYTLGVRAEPEGLVATWLDHDIMKLDDQGAGRRVGVETTVPIPHAVFDEMIVGAPGDTSQLTEPRLYTFSPPRHGAQDFADWRAVEGEWGVGFVGQFHYHLVARTGKSRAATFLRRRPLEGDLREVGISVIPPDEHPRVVVLSFHRGEELSDQPALEVRLILGPRDGHRAAELSAFAADPRDRSTWALGAYTPLEPLTIAIAREGDRLAVSGNDVQLGTILVPSSLKGCRLVVRVLGEPEAVLGVDSIKLWAPRTTIG